MDVQTSPMLQSKVLLDDAKSSHIIRNAGNQTDAANAAESIMTTPPEEASQEEQKVSEATSPLTVNGARPTSQAKDTRPSFKMQNRPAQLIRNLHANYFNRQQQETSSSGSSESAVAKVVRSMRGSIFAFGAMISMAGCAVLLGQGHSGYTWHGIGHAGFLTQVAYHGLFAAACSWQWLRPMALSGDMDKVRGADTDNKECDGVHGDSPSRVGTHSPLNGPAPAELNASSDSVAADSRTQDSSPSSLGSVSSFATLSYWIFSYGLLGLFAFTPASLTGHGWGSLLCNPVMFLSVISPLMMGPCLWGLDAISHALSRDLEHHAAEVDELQKNHESLLDAYSDDNLLKKNILLETVGKEVQDAATLAIETLRQMTPTSLFPPSISREQLSPCTLPIPITSILGLFTTMRHLQYISRNMQRLSRVMFTEYVQGIVEKTSPHYHRGENGFDVGEFVQSLGDLVSADASLKGVEFVIYHAEYDMNHVPIKGSEESWRHALINLIKSIIDSAKTGSTVELCLVLFTIPQPEKEKNKVMVSFEITYSPNPDSTSTEDDLAQLNALLASKLVRAMGGTLEIVQLEKRAKRFIVSVEVEMSLAAQDEKTANLKQLDDQHRPIHPLEPPKTEDAPQPGTIQDRLQRLENMQTAQPVPDSQQFFQQHIKTPLVSPSPPPSSPPPRRIGSGSSPRISTEPTITDLVRFSRKLSGVRAVVMAKENSAFAVRLVGYLRAWGLTIMKRTIRENEGMPSETESDALISEETQPPTPGGGAKRTNSSSSLSGKYSGKAESASSVKSLSSPAFIMIDDDVKALSQQILKLQTSPPSPAPTGGMPRRPTHRRHKSVTSIQHTSIVYFTSLPTFKQARDAIMLTLGTQTPGLSYSIASTLSGNQLGPGPLPYILVLPKPAGPRRVLTAIHTAVHAPILDQSYSPIATAPTPPAPVIRHFSDEINPLERDQIIYDPISRQAFARPISYSTQSSPGGVSPNNSLPQEQRQKRDMLRQLIEAGGASGAVSYPFGQGPTEIMSPETPGSCFVGSPTGVPVPATASQPSGIQFDPTARPMGAPPSSPIVGINHRRISNTSARSSSQSTPVIDSTSVVIPPNAGASSHQTFAAMHAAVQRSSESTAAQPSPNVTRLNGQHLRPFGGRSPQGTPPLITQTSVIFSPPSARHANSGAASPMLSRPEPAALRAANSGGASGSVGVDSPKVMHSLLSHGSIPPASASPLPLSPGAMGRVTPGSQNTSASNHASSPTPATDAAAGRARTSGAAVAKKTKEVSKGVPSLVKSGVVERVSPLVNVLIVEDNPINLKILIKFMKQRKIKYDTACNGKEAVDKWRVGGFHLVLMDIQMPVMDGIEATIEIRRLEKAQKIGVFSTDKPNSVGNTGQVDLLGEPTAVSVSTAVGESSPTKSPPSSSGSSTLPTTPLASPFRSPVIIVALTAEAESADSRNTALLAGCNDYITKPIDFAWLERKIVDWGCMQALIDVDAWKEWKRDMDGAAPGSPGRSSSQGGALVGSGASGSGGASSSQVAALKKTLANAGSVTRANLKRPSISSRSIKGSKAIAAAAVAAAAAAKSAEAAAEKLKEKKKKAQKEKESEKNDADTLAKGASSSQGPGSTSTTEPVVKVELDTVKMEASSSSAAVAAVVVAFGKTEAVPGSESDASVTTSVEFNPNSKSLADVSAPVSASWSTDEKS
ncbi:ssk1 response regulator receiver [Mortierella sp. GBA30]|nr:ssk1 response regulator receiver [Mortierella sp. GBA30]